MKKKGFIVAAVIVLILLVAGGAYLMMSSKVKVQPQAQTQTNNTQTAQPQTVNRNAVKGTILSLLDGGKTVTCTVTLPDNKGSGTFYVASSRKFAGDINTTGTDQKPIATHMISDGTYVYVWSAAMPMGIKMNLTAAKSAASNAQANQAVNMNQQVDMQCGAWTVDDSKFAVPTNIQFRDMSTLLQGAGPQVTTAPQTGTQTGASPCDQIPAGAARTACLNAMQSSGQ